MRGDVIIRNIFQYVIDHKDYAPLYSSFVASVALLLSIINTILTMRRIKKERVKSDARYEEQKRYYEERLIEERQRREEDRKYMDERNRVSEEPYLVLKQTAYCTPPNSNLRKLRLEFINKGRNTAYSIVPDVDIESSLSKEGIELKRNGAVEDPIARAGETFIMYCAYVGEERRTFSMKLNVRLCDASGREYKQTYEVDIIDNQGNFNILNYARPELIKQ